MNRRADTICSTPAGVTRHRAASRRNAAFSLMEVLVAMGVFTVGLVAVAAIFPTAITIQRETVREVDGRRIGKNARATILAAARSDVNPSDTIRNDEPEFEMSYTHDPIPASRSGSLVKFVEDAVTASAFNPTPVLPMIDLPESLPDGRLIPPSVQSPSPVNRALTLNAPMSFHGLLNLDVRSYPKNIELPDRRDYYWYPLLQVSNLTDPSGPSFSATLIVMHRSGTNAPPEVRESNPITDVNGSVITFGSNLLGTTSNDADGDGLPDLIQPGDIVLGNDGRVHRVILADANTITVNSDSIGNPTRIFFGVSIERSTGIIKRESASPVVWIEESIPLSINP